MTTKANIYRVEIDGQDEVSYIEALSMRTAIHLSLHDYPESHQVQVFAQLIEENCTLAEYQNKNPDLFAVA